MLVLPLFFVVIVINFPAGLLVYWITTNFWTMGQQYTVRRLIGHPTPPAPETGPSDGDGRGPGGGPSPPDTNGSSSGGLGALLRGRTKPAEDGAKEREPVGVGSSTRRSAPPPPSPRKKKKRSGRGR